MRLVRSTFLLMMGCVAFIAASPQAPPARGADGQRGAQPATPAGQRGGGGRGRGRGAVQIMTLTSSAWQDGGVIPAKYAQHSGEMSPPLAWSHAPEGVASFALIAHDVDDAIGNGTDDMLQWMLWNIPATATSLPEHLPGVAQLPDGTRQISATGPYYRGPGALADGPSHHYVFELFALDEMLDVPAVGASPPLTRAAVVAAMAGHIRGKAVYTGRFKFGL